MRVSAPGKVLITGGYLVLEPEFSGAVIAASSRFHTTVSLEPLDESNQANEDGVAVRVRSPQFHQTMHGRLTATAFHFTDATENPYVEKTIHVCVAALSGLLGHDSFAARIEEIRRANQCIAITLEADNDFYSQREQLERRGLHVSRKHLATLPRFLPSLLDDAGRAKIAKTGMGSSAALITSLVGALLGFFNAADIPSTAHDDENTRKGVQIVHNLAQICHSIAQEKIGSGFDVSAASYGNQRYTRFRPDGIQAFLNGGAIDPVALAARIAAPWDNIVRPFCLPEGMHMIMGDVNAGSATVSMVRKVLAWKTADPEGSAALWKALNAKNEAIPAGFERIAAHLSQSNSLEALSRLPASEWTAADATVGALLVDLRQTFVDVRSHLREMGTLAGVPIEPADQTALIDATMQVSGVLFAGVPGAGGNDAIFAIVLHESVLDKVEQFWSTWTATSVSALLVDAAPNGWQGGLLRE
ncbi:unnamed protein product [Aphanomyces euteiches]